MYRAVRSVLFAIIVCGRAMPADVPPASVQQIMQTQVNPQGLALWDITNKVLDDRGYLDGSKLSPAAWEQLLAIGKALQSGAATLAGSQHPRVAPPGGKLQYEGSKGALAKAEKKAQP